MYKACNKYFLFILLIFFIAPLQQAEAVIPFETSIPETAGKISTWIQEKISLVQAKIASINESKIGKGIGDGLKKIKEVRDCVKEQYSGVETPSETCQKYVQKYSFLAGAIKMAGNAKRFIGSIKDSKSYKIIQLTRLIAEDAIKLVQLDEYREDRVNRLKNEADIEIEAIDGKIEMAKDDLKIMKEEHNRLKSEANIIEKGHMEAEELEMTNYIAQLEASKLYVKEHLVKEIVNVDSQFATTAAEITKRRAKNVEEVLELKAKLKEDEERKGNNRDGNSSDETQTPAEIVLSAQEKYSLDANTTDTIAKSQERVAKIKEDVQASNISSFNKANVYITVASDPANDPSSDLELGETSEGKSETIQSSIDNTLTQIDLIEKIIQLELDTLEAQVMEKIMNSSGYKVERRQSGNNSLVTDVCSYKVKETKNNPASTATSSDNTTGSSNNGSAASNNAGENNESKVNDKTKVNEIIL